MELDTAAEMLERRWFATFKAASAARTECEALLEALALTEAAWEQARERLAKMEALRDALAEELGELDGLPPNERFYRPHTGVCSAA
jgi:chromosome segregation ATPase